MKEIKTNTTEEGIEKALAMYVETVSPSKDNLIAILSQIPEQKIKKSLPYLSDMQGKTIISPEVYHSYKEGEISSFDTAVHQTSKTKKAVAIRSPYIWLEITELVMLFSIMLVALPTLTKSLNDPFYQIDKQVEIFEVGIQAEDAQDSLIDSSL